jgi:hypothetical protein
MNTARAVKRLLLRIISNVPSLKEKRGVCDFGNDWILSRLGQHITTIVFSRCGQVVYVS